VKGRKQVGGSGRSVSCDWHSQGLWKGGLVGGQAQSWVRGAPGQKGDWCHVGGMSRGVAGGKKAGGGKVGGWELVGGRQQLDRAGGFWMQASPGVKQVGRAQGKMQHDVL